jgi:hypothetical protein
MMGAPDRVLLKPLIHFEHNYNYVSRAAMYSWMNKHLKLGLREPILEEDYKRLSKDELSVWNDQHPKPEGGPEFERRLLRWLTTDAEKQLQTATGTLDEYRQQIGTAVDVVIGRNLGEVGQVVWNPKAVQDRVQWVELTGLLRNASHDEELPIIRLQPKNSSARVVIWLDDAGKAGLFSNADGVVAKPKPEVRKLLDAGVEVIGVDLLYQGEFLKDGQPLAHTPRVKNPRESAAYTFGYNRSVFAQRVHDVLTLARFARDQQEGNGRALGMVALDRTSPIAAAARAQAGDAIQCAAMNTGGFRFGQVLDLQSVNFLPGGAKYHDLPGMLALGAPGRLWLAGEQGGIPELVKTVYGKAGAADHLTASTVPKDQERAAVSDWLLSNL